VKNKSWKYITRKYSKHKKILLRLAGCVTLEQK